MDKSDRLDIGADFDRRAGDYETQSFWASDSYVASQALDLLRARKIGDLLDIGGGSGLLAARIIETMDYSSATVLDPSPKMLTNVRPEIKTVCARFEDSLFEKNSFDTILLRQVLHYVEDPTDVIQRATELLRENGKIYIGQIVAPDPSSAAWLKSVGLKLSPNRRRVWTIEELITFMLSLGLTLLEAKLHGFVDNVRDWAHRGVIELDIHRFLLESRSSLPDEVAGLLRIEPEDPNLQFETYWFHGLFTTST